MLCGAYISKDITCWKSCACLFQNISSPSTSNLNATLQCNTTLHDLNINALILSPAFPNKMLLLLPKLCYFSDQIYFVFTWYFFGARESLVTLIQTWFQIHVNLGHACSPYLWHLLGPPAQSSIWPHPLTVFAGWSDLFYTFLSRLTLSTWSNPISCESPANIKLPLLSV